MILDKQEWKNHVVALCAYWACHQLLRQDQNHRYVTHGGDVFAICTDHIIGKDEKFEMFPTRPPDATVRKTASGWDMSGLQEFATKLAESGGGFIAMGDNSSGEWHQIKPEPIFDDAGNRLETFDHANQIDKLDAIADTVPLPEPVQHFSEEELKSLESKEFVFTHEVNGEHDYIYKEYNI